MNTKVLFDLPYQDYLQMIESSSIEQMVDTLIICSHPHCLTNGRGNERGVDELVEIDTQILNDVDLPVFSIKRGGGLTFHHPGQIILYPHFKISPHFNLEDVMCALLKSTSRAINEFFNLKTITAKRLVGVWLEKKKLASLGLGVHHFITQHGLALNYLYDPKMSKVLKNIYPCGLDSSTYTSIEEVTGLERQKLLDLREAFVLNIIECFKGELALTTTKRCKNP